MIEFMLRLLEALPVIALTLISSGAVLFTVGMAMLKAERNAHTPD